MTFRDIIILGAGPCGLSTAIALSKASSLDPESPVFRITLVELRPKIETIGGTINLTPLAMRYIQHLGAGDRVKENSISLDSGIDYISLTSGLRLGNFWGGIGARRISRHHLVQALLDTLVEEHPGVYIQWGKCVTRISEVDEGVLLEFQDGSSNLRGDILFGCDGLHSAARSLWVEPDRPKIYANRVVAMGWVEDVAGNNSETPFAPITLPNGSPALRDTAMFNGLNGSILVSYYKPDRNDVYFANVTEMEEPENSDRSAWKLRGQDQEAVRRNIMDSYRGGKVNGLEALLERCQNWHLYPIYALPAEGLWYKGRVHLLGDAAHAMPPQGESTGLAIEDGILIARIFQRCKTRSIEQMFLDFENLRKAPMAKHHKDASWLMANAYIKGSGITAYLQEWAMAGYLLFKRWRQEDHFAGDVRDLKLPD